MDKDTSTINFIKFKLLFQTLHEQVKVKSIYRFNLES